MKPVFEVDIKMHKKMCIFAGSLYTPNSPSFCYLCAGRILCRNNKFFCPDKEF